MGLIVKCLALCGLLAAAGCGTASSYLTAAPPVVQTVAEEPAATAERTAPRRRPIATRDAETMSSASAQESRPLDYNSPEWREREKRRDEELNRKIKGICSGC